MSITIKHIINNKFLVNNTMVTVYRDMDNDVVTNPIIEPLQLKILRQFITALPGSVKQGLVS